MQINVKNSIKFFKTHSKLCNMYTSDDKNVVHQFIAIMFFLFNQSMFSNIFSAHAVSKSGISHVFVWKIERIVMAISVDPERGTKNQRGWRWHGGAAGCWAHLRRGLFIYKYAAAGRDRCHESKRLVPVVIWPSHTHTHAPPTHPLIIFFQQLLNTRAWMQQQQQQQPLCMTAPYSLWLRTFHNVQL